MPLWSEYGVRTPFQGQLKSTDSYSSLTKVDRNTNGVAPAVESLDELVQQLRVIFDSDNVNVNEVKALLSAYKSNPTDWRKYAKFDKYRYTRNLVDTGNGRYNLMLLCWGESHGSCIHDHSNAHCFVKILEGELKETMFAWPSVMQGWSEAEQEARIDSVNVEPNAMQEISANFYGKDGVTYINDSLGLHRMENPSHITPAVSLHLYCPPFKTCRTFDQRTCFVNTVSMPFWSEYGVRTPFQGKVNECSRVSSVGETGRRPIESR